MSTVVDLHQVTEDWLSDGRRVVAATLVETIGSAPFPVGAEMFFDEDGHVEGSVTGGCVESALAQEAVNVLRTRETKLLTYGISDEQAAGVGLMCGGTVRIFVHELEDAGARTMVALIHETGQGKPAALATLLTGPSAGCKISIFPHETVGTLGVTPLLDHSVSREALGFLDEGKSGLRRYGAGGEVMGSELAVFLQAFSAPPTMVIFGAIDYSVAVAEVAATLGYKVTICDARAAFAESPRFREIAEVAVEWPDQYMRGRSLGPRDAVLVFTHDPKFDEPALVAALESGAGYVGALGSRRTHAQRAERLHAIGISEGDLDRIHAPCGLDLGARTPTETAISILAEIISVRTGRSSASLSETSGPIHPTDAELS